MKILDEILEQYMQIGLKNKQYKNSFQNLNLFTNKNATAEKHSLDENLKTQSIHISKKIRDNQKEYINETVNVKEFYNRLEFDARRYNRNFDSQTGAVLL